MPKILALVLAASLAMFLKSCSGDNKNSNAGGTTTTTTTTSSSTATTGMNSLYIWSGVRPPNLALIGSELNILTPDEQMDTLRALVSHAHQMVVHDTVHGPDDTRPMMREIRRDFRQWRQVGPYVLLVPKGRPVGYGRTGMGRVGE